MQCVDEAKAPSVRDYRAPIGGGFVSRRQFRVQGGAAHGSHSELQNLLQGLTLDFDGISVDSR